MKNILFVLLAVWFATLTAQKIEVEKISGKVFVMKGTGEEYTEVKKADTLSLDDMIITSKDSYISLKKGYNKFLLKSNSALDLNHLKKMSREDLLLALAMEEIRNIPRKKSDDNTGNTAVYGANENRKTNIPFPSNNLGELKINGAKQLAKNGFSESAVVAAKETFRKHPSAKTNFADRLFFANILFELELYEEALTDYNNILELNLSDSEMKTIDKKIEEIKLLITGEN